jgi:two-component system sensor histidine kinase KdpD
VVTLRPHNGRLLDVEQRHLLEVFARQAALAYERGQLAEEARASALRARTEELRSSLLSAVSHDLRTPLAAITGAATTLRDRAVGLEETQRAELLDAICEEAERLERLVANLLDMTRLQSGDVQVKCEWVPLEELIGSALTRLEAQLGGRRVDTVLAPSMPMVSVDPVLFGQVFVNLLENVAKYTPPGSAVDIAARYDSKSVTITVGDRGPGFAPGDVEHVFEKFYRGQGTGKPGAGLGLAIVDGIVQAHRGAVSATNREGGGALFTIVLPVEGTPPPAEAPTEVPDGR